MAAITYVAKREIEPTGFNASGTDLSAAHSDNSFDSVSTVLTGILNNQWALVAGFANAGNNGWFQASADSTATKIAQDTSVNLVTEAAGPTVSIVGYARGLGQSYSLEFHLGRNDRSVQVKRSVQQPLGGGAPEVLRQRNDKFVDVTAIGNDGSYITEAQLPQWREFLASVEAGESLTFDAYGTIASPDDPHTAMLMSESYKEERIGAARLYQLSFQLKLLD